MSNIYDHSQREFNRDEIKTQIIAIKKEIVDLIVEKDDLRMHHYKDIIADYTVKFGAFEYKFYKVIVDLFKINREVYLMYRSLSRNKKIDLVEIQMMLEIEFKEHNQKLDEKIQDLNMAISYIDDRGKFFNDAKSARWLYRTIVERIHPDLNRNLDEDELKIFSRATEAFEENDVETLNIIDMIIGQNIMNFDCFLDQELIDYRDMVSNYANNLKLEISSLKESYPFTLNVYLENKDRATDYINQLNDEIDRYLKELKSFIRLKDKLIEGNRNH